MILTLQELAWGIGILTGLTVLASAAGSYFGTGARLRWQVEGHDKKLEVLERELYGNGKPGIKWEVADMQSDVINLLKNCERTHAEEAKRFEQIAQDLKAHQT